jgi:hypothetical protein
MKKPRLPLLRGLTVQILAITVLPLTLLLLLIAFGSYSLHQRDMRALVSDRDERAVQSAAAALEAELHHRMASISSLATVVDSSGSAGFENVLSAPNDLTSDFDAGAVLVDPDRHLIFDSERDEFWNDVLQNSPDLRLASAWDPGPVLSDPVMDPASKQMFVIISAYSLSRHDGRRIFS